MTGPALIRLRAYQIEAFLHTAKTLILHWSRQIGKSFTLAAWAVDRCLVKLVDNTSWTVTVLSNSRANGAELMLKVNEVCQKMGQAVEEVGNREELDQRTDLPEDIKYEMMRFEARVIVGGRVGRIIVLAANPRTARGFSGDLILDEFAFHEDSRAIWEAAEPIISSRQDYQCRISSTGNGRLNMFYQLISEGRMPVHRVKRSEAWARKELKIYSAIDGRELTPDEARAESSDKRAYDQNYECAFNDEAMPLLTHELISAAERSDIEIDRQQWSEVALERMRLATSDIFAGQDVGRNRDLSFLPSYTREGSLYRPLGMLTMEDMRLPLQQRQLDAVCEMKRFRRAEIDMTGIGLGLYEYAEEKHGDSKIGGVNFSSTEPVTDRIRAEGRKAATARVTELMALALLEVFEDRAIEIPPDKDLRDDLRKPERITSPGGRVSIAATRDEAGHADRFWGLALMVRASKSASGPFHFTSIARGSGAYQEAYDRHQSTRRILM